MVLGTLVVLLFVPPATIASARRLGLVTSATLSHIGHVVFARTPVSSSRLFRRYLYHHTRLFKTVVWTLWPTIGIRIEAVAVRRILQCTETTAMSLCATCDSFLVLRVQLILRRSGTLYAQNVTTAESTWLSKTSRTSSTSFNLAMSVPPALTSFERVALSVCSAFYSASIPPTGSHGRLRSRHVAYLSLETSMLDFPSL